MTKMAMVLSLLLVVGCTSVSTNQREIRYDPETGAKTTEIVTKSKGTAFFESEQALTGLKAEQTEGSQGFELTGLNQSASSTNLTEIITAVVGAAINAAR
jgi:hypothetical protein